MSNDNRRVLGSLIQDKGSHPGALVPLLLSIQDHFGYLPQALLELIPEMTRISPAMVRGVATYYSHFRLRPAGKHMIKVCTGTACYVKGAEQTYSAFRERLKIRDEDDTDPERLFTIAKVACLGCCMLAPAVQIDDRIYGWVTPSDTRRVLEEFLNEAAAPAPQRPESFPEGFHGEIRLCLCSSCAAAGADKVYRELREWTGRTGIPLKTALTGCTGLSFRAPLLRITDRAGKVFQYGRVQGEDLHTILVQHFQGGSLESAMEAILYTNPDPAGDLRFHEQSPETGLWFADEHRIVTANSRHQPFDDLPAYRSGCGFAGLARAKDLGPAGIIAEVTAANLLGRGGGGFPAGRKWERTAAAIGPERYLIGNADEGDPGAFMDRMLLESVPFRVIEGMMIAALAIGARQGFIFVRREYPLAIRRIRAAIRQCEQDGLLCPLPAEMKEGFSLTIVEGAGAFVCGEETALIAAIEGERGIPRERPPYPSERGLFGAPTLINNVETLATIPWILVHGAQAFRNQGTSSSPGTKTFALAGKVKQGGLIEVPMGITIRKVIEEIGGGVSGNGALKAVQIGGPSGGCLPVALFDLPIDFQALSEYGAIMGSGGLVVLDEHDCMVDIARYFMEFTANESCGNCSFCRIGTQRILEILNRLGTGSGKAGDLELLEELSARVKQGSRCGLGKTAPNPVLTTLKYFRPEYESHLSGFCPAGKCRNLFTFVAGSKCNGCMLCARGCPVGAIPFQPWERAEIDPKTCIRCGACRQICPEHAIEVTPNTSASETRSRE
jgi:NADH:ubiquinone oxidoreductase subunit F (NADH-binding)/NADH:ubiquinone oxidoreductase subunit E